MWVHIFKVFWNCLRKGVDLVMSEISHEKRQSLWGCISNASIFQLFFVTALSDCIRCNGGGIQEC
jgi:hypothetical protein